MRERHGRGLLTRTRALVMQNIVGRFARTQKLKTCRFALGPKNVHQPWPLDLYSFWRTIVFCVGSVHPTIAQPTHLAFLRCRRRSGTIDLHLLPAHDKLGSSRIDEARDQLHVDRRVARSRDLTIHRA